MNPKVLFHPPPPNLEIVNGDAHVFCASLDDHAVRLEQHASVLSSDEQERAGRFIFPRDRDRFVIGRGLLRQTMARLLHIDPGRLRFAYGSHGKPRMKSPIAGRYLHFNVAHADDLIVIIVSGKSQVGIDVERLRPIPEMEQIVSQCFPEADKSAWRAQPPIRKMQFFFHRWTRMEALLKATGRGLNQPQGTSSVMAKQSNWHFHSIIPAAGYTVAAATKEPAFPHCWAE